VDQAPVGGVKLQTGISRKTFTPVAICTKDRVVLRSIKQLHGDKLAASDGEIGHVKDFYFDDQNWVIRYLVVDTGSWLSGRLVLISPHAFGDLYEDAHRLVVNLTRLQIESSPAIEEHKPVSRQYEEEYHRHYGWPAYWEGGGMWGTGAFPLGAPPLQAEPVTGASGDSSNRDDPHLRSTRAVRGYQIQTIEGPIGHVIDFMIDDKSWAIRGLLVDTCHWFRGKEIVISPEHVTGISYEESKVFVDVSKQAIERAKEYHVPRATYHDTRGFDD